MQGFALVSIVGCDDRNHAGSIGHSAGGIAFAGQHHRRRAMDADYVLGSYGYDGTTFSATAQLVDMVLHLSRTVTSSVTST